MTNLANIINKRLKQNDHSKRLFIKADKSRIIFQKETNNCNTLVDKEVTEFYKTNNNEAENNINKEAKNMVIKLKLANRIKRLAKEEPLIKLKDHKDNFFDQTNMQITKHHKKVY